MTARPSAMTERPNFDVLSDVLRAVRLRAAVFFDVTASSPWVAEAPPARDIAPFVMPGSNHIIEFHVVLRGECWAGLIDEPAIRLEAGDIVVFPQGDAHVLASAPGQRAVASIELHARAAQGKVPLRLDLGGSGGDPVSIVCGFLACDARPFNPLLATLPRVLRHARSAPLEQFMRTTLEEAHVPRPGGEVVLARLCELMFMEVVRDYIAKGVVAEGWLAGLRDETVGRALAALHARPAHPWSLDILAHAVATSRSALASRFMALVGLPPMQYLAQWRMQLAATLLGGPLTLAAIAAEVGYGSEAAFSRAFKKIVGVAPAHFRAQSR